MLNINGQLRGLRTLMLGVLLGLYVSGSAYAAFTPTTAPLLSSAAVAPNVMLLVDNSGSMDNVIRDPAFDQSVVRPQIYFCEDDVDLFPNNCNTTTTPVMENENIELNRIYVANCPAGYSGFSKTSRNHSLSFFADYCLKLPDPAGNRNTRYSTRYLAYLISLAGNQTTKDFTTGIIPTDTRMNTARTVSSALVTANRGLRIGLATFNPSVTNDIGEVITRGPGGSIVRPIMDLQNSGEGNTNYNGLLSAIGKLASTSFTPLAETYYEITRYYRGMPPLYGLLSTPYTSPIQYRCQRNFGVVITDGLPTFDRTFPSDDPAVVSSPNTLPNWDGVNNDGNYLDGDLEGDTLYLDDIAKFAYDIDMRTGNEPTDNAKKSWDATDFPKQNLFTYTIGFTASNQMLSDAASYGHGKYYQANDGATLTSALTQALNEISSKAGSGGGGTTTSSNSYKANFYYQSLYDSVDWSGTIRAYAFGSDGSLNTAGTPAWTTNTTMAAGTTAGTFQSWNTSTNKAIPLVYDSFSADQRSVIDANLKNLSSRSSTGANLKGADLIAWTKGTAPAGLRVRTRLLGDVIGSPVVLASGSTQTAADLTGDTSYSNYLSIKASKMTDSLLVNANDGLTNVINATNGQRRFAYLPSTTLPSLYLVEDPTYINGVSHKFLNDGQLSVFDVQIGTTWKTIAFGGTGGAAKAFYALQLFDTNTDSLGALWEIRAPDTPSLGNAFNDLGYAYAKPDVARLPDGTWAAFISNGYGSNTGVAALYIVNVATGALIKKIVVDPTEKDNGLASVKLVVNASNVVQAAYGGDLKGRLWKFDLSSPATSNWGLAFSGKPLFTAPGGASQPITAQPLVAANPTSGYMVYVGTGKFLEIPDKTSTATQSFYGIWDAAGGTGGFTVGNLQPQAITTTFNGTGGTYLAVSQNTVDYTTKKGWYLPLEYNSTMIGERVINQATYTRGRIVFTTAGVDTSDPCSSQGFGRLIELEGVSGKMLTYPVIDTNGDGVVNSDDAISAGVNFATGIPTLNAVVSDGSGSSSAPDTKVINTSNAVVTSIKELGGSGGGRRIMWRQIQ
jgi:type IV pilus assembly protein PilY1